MNCTRTSEIATRYFLSENLGASIFISVYIGLYGISLIIYFAYQLMDDTAFDQENGLSQEFFSTFHQINEREEIYNRLTNREWVKEVYKIYYSSEAEKCDVIEEKAEQCSRKYQEKMQNLRSKHTYYVTDVLTSSPLITTV
ncbi:unnamed protein product [Adineta ricciae]|uniref:Uncharacterized protein n=1 Tax=Adineta ricciae TaxID=249248 RepID=A0A815G5K1_ADIRI|nr:unnamed protein product [Adineta ricciae]